MEKAKGFQKSIYFCFIDYSKAFDCLDHNKLWKMLKKMGIPDHLTCLLRNLYAGQEEAVRTRHETDSKLGKEYKGYILSSCLYTEYVMQTAKLDESQTGIKISRRNINNLKHSDETTLMAESEKDLKSHLMKVKEKSEETGLKLMFQKLRSRHLVPSCNGK